MIVRVLVGWLQPGLGLCLGGTELNHNGPWTGTETGPTVLSIATDGSVSSDGITSIIATCQ